MDMPDVFHAVSDLLSKQGLGALCIVVRSRGSTPRHASSKMLVYSNGSIIGTVGGGELENQVIQEALKVMNDGQTRLLEFSMIDPTRGDVGVCGGQVEVYVEPILPKPILVVIGSGHVGKAVTHIAHWLGFHVAVSDDRPELCSNQVVPDADDFYVLPMKELPGKLKITPWTYIVLTTRGSATDIEGLPALLETHPAYIGVIGSQRRWVRTRKALLEIGVSEEKLQQIHSPIGIELEAETPEEIAVSIMAEIIKIRNSKE
jgi:xanthine dehydrogenase accessory factor